MADDHYCTLQIRVLQWNVILICSREIPRGHRQCNSAAVNQPLQQIFQVFMGFRFLNSLFFLTFWLQERFVEMCLEEAARLQLKEQHLYR